MSLSLIWTEKSSGVPAGAYVLVFKGTEETSHEQFGAGLNFNFEVIEGVHKTRTIKRMTGNKPSPKNACGMMIVSLLGGRKLSEGEDITASVNSCIGKKYSGIVSQTDKGPRLTAIVPLQ